MGIRSFELDAVRGNGERKQTGKTERSRRTKESGSIVGDCAWTANSAAGRWAGLSGGRREHDRWGGGEEKRGTRHTKQDSEPGDKTGAGGG